MLKLTSIFERFGGLSILQDVSIEVPQGSIFGLTGPNDAGKTTVFNLTTGLLAPTGGSLTFNGDNLVGKKPYQITQMGIAHTLRNIRIFREVTLPENVMAGMHRYLDYGVSGLLLSLPKYRAARRHARSRALELLSWVEPDHKAHDIADNSSYDDQRRLKLARALATELRLLLLNELVAGMNTGEKVDLMAEIENIKARGYTIFVIEHDMRFIVGLCERIAMPNFGRTIAEELPEAIRNDPQVIEACLSRNGDGDTNSDAPQKETA